MCCLLVLWLYGKAHPGGGHKGVPVKGTSWGPLMDGAVFSCVSKMLPSEHFAEFEK